MPFDGRILSGVSVLAAVVDGGSFVKAAELIGLTDSGVSRAISRLETRLGVRLLDRTTRSVTLHRRGTSLLRGGEAAPQRHRGRGDHRVGRHLGRARPPQGRHRPLLPAASARRPARPLLRTLSRACDRVRHRASVSAIWCRKASTSPSASASRASRRLVSRKLIEAPILTVASPRYLEALRQARASFAISPAIAKFAPGTFRF